MFRDMNSGYSGYSMSNRVIDDNGKLLLKKKIDSKGTQVTKR